MAATVAALGWPAAPTAPQPSFQQLRAALLSEQSASGAPLRPDLVHPCSLCQQAATSCTRAASRGWLLHGCKQLEHPGARPPGQEPPSPAAAPHGCSCQTCRRGPGDVNTECCKTGLFLQKCVNSAASLRVQPGAISGGGPARCQAAAIVCSQIPISIKPTCVRGRFPSAACAALCSAGLCRVVVLRLVRGASPEIAMQRPLARTPLPPHPHSPTQLSVLGAILPHVHSPFRPRCGNVVGSTQVAHGNGPQSKRCGPFFEVLVPGERLARGWVQALSQPANPAAASALQCH
jgi:hypothetical protein